MLEPVATAILAAIVAGAAAGVTDTAKQAIGDAYKTLKGLLVRKLGGQSKAVEAINKLEEDPESAGWKETAGKELAKAGVDNDQDLVAAANQVMAKLQDLPQGERQHIQQAIGSYDVAQADRGGTAKVIHGTKTKE